MTTEPSKPTRRFPNGSVAAPSNSNGMVTLLVTPLMVRSPVSSTLLGPVWWMPVEANVISGYSSMARKSLLRRWASRCSLRVSMLAAWMVRVAVDAEVLGIDDRAALELVERAADLGDHRVPGDEPDPGVRGVDAPGAGEVGDGGRGGGRVGHGVLLRSGRPPGR